MKTKTLKSLQNLVESAIELQENWDESLEFDYPFSQPFDDLVDDLMYWLVAVKLRNKNPTD
ncbi:hypothetical protein [Effusibacillus consociatus]|uniref:Uncharacterized protein n=1 Tax=Effusibacillus consociatus TaxID=1117041 RepID=A0ABV9Q6T4_9BACL